MCRRLASQTTDRTLQDDPNSPPDYRHPDPATDAALDWFVCLRDDDSAATRAAFDAWRNRAPDHARAFEAVARTASLSAALGARHSAMTDRAASPAGGRAPLRRLVPRGRMAGLALTGLAAMLAFVLIAGPDLLIRLRADVTTAAGEERVTELPDGSRVTLNTDSAIRLDFSGNRRAVEILKGEAFFQVAHDAAKPFVVTAQYGTVTVTGTEFVVRRDAGDDHVLLRQGHVRVRAASGNGLADLSPGQSVDLLHDGVSQVVAEDPARGLAWLDGRVELRDMAAGAAVAELARYRAAPVLVMPVAGRAHPVDGTFQTRAPDEAIRALASAAGLSVRALPGGALILY